ncbi:HTH-type transcriptional regulator EthR [Pseudonocardia adelaidensis]|uniref:HTH-type transcriptional regulator EthR n=1 Tax=Pseudonocardia adelaidensis TaxID=648754 RepID=A0ABP9NG21_9PSEU
MRAAILEATESLLARRPFDKLAVAEILAAAGVSRASFYFYFGGKHDVLAELVRGAVQSGHATAESWTARAGGGPPEPALRRSVTAGSELWRRKAPVLRAIVENWHTDPQLTELWTVLMAGFTAATAERIERDRAEGVAPRGGLPADHLASALTWLSERLQYLAAAGVAPFDDEDVLVDTITGVWLAAVYGSPPR